MTEQIAQFRPGDQTTITFVRNGKEMTKTINFKNKLGTTDIVKADALPLLGAGFTELSKADCQNLRINGGLYVSRIDANGILSKQTRMRKGFVITRVNDKPIQSQLDLEKLLASGENEFQLEGIYPNYQGTYNYFIRLNG
jgi:S1-C subfamily serine protease